MADDMADRAAESPVEPRPDRRRELAERLERVRAQIADAARVAGRGADDVTLVVVTKTWPASDVALLADLGVRDVGENRHQEAEAKAAEVAGLGVDVRWHFIGQIQSNKAARIARYADVVHSVDSTRVAQRLNAGAHAVDRTIDCLIQVSLDPDPAAQGRGGLAPDDVWPVAQAIDNAGALRLAGVMGVAPLGGDPRSAYALLSEVATRLRVTHPDADWISAGMSGDFVPAVEAGATHVRVGSAVLGERPPLG
jgi:pyridoxal phosphate enzyme (YggS family)